MKLPAPHYLIVVGAVISAAAAGAVALTGQRSALVPVQKGDLVSHVVRANPIDGAAKTDPSASAPAPATPSTETVAAAPPPAPWTEITDLLPAPAWTETAAVNLPPASPWTETAAVNLPPAPPSTETAASDPPPAVEPSIPAGERMTDDAQSEKLVEIAHIGEGDMCSRRGGQRLDFQRGRRMSWRCVYDKR
jgi:hypothetical protein